MTWVAIIGPESMAAPCCGIVAVPRSGANRNLAGLIKKADDLQMAASRSDIRGMPSGGQSGGRVGPKGTCTLRCAGQRLPAYGRDAACHDAKA